MAIIGNTVPTLHDVVSRNDPDGSLANIVELLRQSTPIVDHIPWLEANGKTFHRTTLRTSYPTAYLRRYNEGVLPSKSGTAQVDEPMAMIESWSEIDRDLFNLNNRSASWRRSEEDPFKQAMALKFVDQVLYGNHAVEPKGITGLSTRYGDVNLGETSGAAKDGAIVDAGGSGSDNTSVWLIGFSPTTVHGIYPSGSPAGLQSKDAGERPTKDANGGNYWIVQTHFKWDCGIAVRDWRAIIRIANIDVSNLIGESSAADLIKLMIKALNRRPVGMVANWHFYCNAAVMTMLEIQALAKSANTTTIANVAGQEVMSFRGVPIHRLDQILNTEAQLT